MKLIWNGSLRRPRRIWKDNIEMDEMEMFF
jgi:hypothetical protein